MKNVPKYTALFLLLFFFFRKGGKEKVQFIHLRTICESPNKDEEKRERELAKIQNVYVCLCLETIFQVISIFVSLFSD